jgi:glycosyltransferase involved in cell wall biosynthesis
MKVLFDHPSPFLLAHGGFQNQIEETRNALEKIGLIVEHLRWWDAEQRGDVIQFFGRPPESYIDFAHKKNIRVVMTELLTGLAARSSIAISMQSLMIRSVRACLPSVLWERMGWDAYAKADCIVAVTPWEADLMRRVFDAPSERVKVVPAGVADEFLAPGDLPVERGQYLVCTATVTERKRVLEMAQAAIHAETPLWVIGKPYTEADPYFQQFRNLCLANAKLLRYEGAVQDRQLLARIYREARGFVLLSSMESLSLSALEAAACECPLLFSDLPWARSVFGDNAMYCPIASTQRTAEILREFYDAAPSLNLPPKPMDWIQVAQKYKTIYEEVLSTSR